MFDSSVLVLSFHSKKTLESVPFERLVMTGVKTGISGSEGMGCKGQSCVCPDKSRFFVIMVFVK